MAFPVVNDPGAIQDIPEAIDYYDKEQAGLGARFEGTLNKHLLTLEKILSSECVMTISAACPLRSFLI